MAIRYVHTNLVARDWRGLAAFYCQADVPRRITKKYACLHAWQLGFEHPIVPGKRVQCLAPLPPDMAAAVQAAGFDLPQASS